MNKVRINVSLPPELLEKFDRKIADGNRDRSEEIQKLMEKALDVHKSDDPELKRKIQKLKNRKEEREQTREEVSSEIDDLEQRISMYQKKVEEKKQTENQLDEAVESLGQRLEEKRLKRGCSDNADALNRVCSSEPFWDWVNRLDVESEKLKSKLRDQYVSEEKEVEA